MERIQNILQRLQEIYYGKHQKSAIDIDLMLDYTRVMYADLLEWKQQLPVTVNDNPMTDNVDERRGKAAEAVIDRESESNHEMKENQVAGSGSLVEKSPVIEDPRQQIANLIESEEKGISFEPPHPAVHPEVVDKVLIEEEPQVNEPVENIEIPVVAEEPAVTAFMTHGNTATATDIRSGIGINDKYLFLNELFNNHKTEYEETLDRLNRFKGYEEAYSWIIANTATNNKWTEDDETVQGFFAVLKKHFSASR